MDAGEKHGFVSWKNTMGEEILCTAVILSEARTQASVSRRIPKMSVLTMLHQGVLTILSRENALMLQYQP
jgi:hypothetical protein